jgi:conjugal transfer pilus assembly protein TraL
MNNDKYYIPKHLNDPPRWLFWTMDEATILISGFALGVLFNHILIAGVLGIALMLLLKKLKGKEGNSFLLNRAYWYFPLCKQAFKITPPSYIKEYIG